MLQIFWWGFDIGESTMHRKENGRTVPNKARWNDGAVDQQKWEHWMWCARGAEIQAQEIWGSHWCQGSWTQICMHPLVVPPVGYVGAHFCLGELNEHKSELLLLEHMCLCSAGRERAVQATNASNTLQHILEAPECHALVSLH